MLLYCLALTLYLVCNSQPECKRVYDERLEAAGAGGQEKQNRNTVNSNCVAWEKKQCDANPTIVNFFLSAETDADISIYSFSSFRLLVRSLLVAKQQ